MSNTDANSLKQLDDLKRSLMQKILQGKGKFNTIQKRDQYNDIPLSFAQRRIWFLEQLLPNTSVYNIVGGIKITGQINREALNRAITDIINRHEALRTEYIVKDTNPVQHIIDKFENIEIPMVDLIGKVENNTSVVYEVINEEANCNIDITKAPLLKMKLFRTKQDEHYLFINMHHIISDGWSMGIFQKEIMTEYSKYARNLNTPSKELSVQYGDFSQWQNNRINTKQLDRQLQYWEKKLENVTAKVDFPYDKVRKLVTNYKGNRIPIHISAEVTAKINEISKVLNTTNYMFLLSALNIMQFKYSQETDITVGCPIANRNQKEIEDIIGFFVNTLVIRTNIDKEVTFRELLEQNKTNTVEAYSNQDIPFELVVERLQPDRTMSVNSPLFQTGFVFQNTPLEKVEMENLELEVIDIFNGMSIFEILLALTEKEGKMEGYLEYCVDLYAEETITRIARQYETLVADIVNDIDRPISQLNMLPTSEEEMLVEKGRRKEVHPVKQCIHKRFEEIASKFANRVALRFEEQSFTYDELNRYADVIAKKLKERGVKPGDFVGVYMERSVEMVASILGILKAGGVYVPINTLYPKERVEYIVKDSDLQVLLTHGEDVDKNIVGNEKTWEINLGEFDITENVQYQSFNDINGGAYVIYTSGSTGNPKGVLVEHSNVMRLFTATDKWYNFSENDVWTLFHSHAFDFSVWEIWGALLYGGTLVVVPYYISRSVSEFYDLVKREGVTVLNQTPSAFKQFMVIDKEAKDEKLDKLKYVIFGGEALDIQSLGDWFKKYGDNQPLLVNMYGITETTVHVTYRPIKKEDLLKSGSTIGEPIPDLDLYLLDENMKLVPMGMPGEICVGGAGVARGYLKRPELTSKKFVRNPFTEGEEKLYRSGDLARYNAQGELEFMGRIDTQVKVRGFRLELGEIENVLKEQDEVKDAVVILKKDSLGLDKLIGYVIEEEKEDKKEHDTKVTEQWSSVFNQTYGESGDKDAKFNIIGWNSLYNNEPIPADEMKQWVEATVDLISEKPAESILEVGCGTGLLLYRLAKGCKRYVGTDISDTAINGLKANMEGYDMVELYCQPADVMNSVSGKFDKVIINSVIQYFPSAEYLVEVIKNQVKVIKDKGIMILGDIRNLESLEIFYRDIEKCRAEKELTEEELINRVRNRLETEHELIISPEFFYALKYHVKEITGVEIRLKKGDYVNELSQFRYDVVLHINNTDVKSVEKEVEWKAINGKEGIKQLVNEGYDYLLVKHIPNARLSQFNETDETIEYINPADFEIMQLEGYKVDIVWAGMNEPFYFDVLIRREVVANDAFEINYAKVSRDYREYINNPINEVADDKHQVKYKEYLRKKLPDYMVPDSIVIMQAFPLTFNGKVDIKSLPVPEKGRANISTTYIAPETKYEKLLADIWMDVLDIDDVGIEDNFFELGGHSLLATQVIFKIKDLLQVQVPLKYIFEAGTIKELAKLIENKEVEKGDLASIDLYDEVKLKYPVMKKENAKVDIESADYILLTGATGFLGAFLLKSLIAKTRGQIVCLVRANDEMAARERLRNNLMAYACYTPEMEERIEILCGDLASQMFGLEESKFIELAQKVKVIYHNGNLVNFSAPYSTHKPANVDGIQEMLKFMDLGCNKEMHYVSTTHVFAPADAQNGVIYEDSKAEHPYELTMGYTQSKWVAEQIIQKAVQEGLRINIYRPGRIWGDLKNGICQKNDFMWLLLETVIQTKMAPDMGIDVNVIPVDFLADSIVNLSKTNFPSGTAFNMVNSQNMSWNQMMVYLRDLGYELEPVTMPQWMQEIENYVKQEKDIAIYTLLPMLTGRDTAHEANATFDNQKMVSGLEKYDMQCPALDFELLKKYLNNRKIKGYI